MAELLSPGVFIEEVPSQVQVIQAVSTSNLGTVGFTQRGPENEPTLVTSFEDFTRIFGPIISESFLPLSMAAYFANGGRRAFVVRVVPGDATAADAKIDSAQTDQQIETGDGSTDSFSKTASTTTLVVNDGASPIVASSFTLSWRNDGTPVVGENVRNRDDSADVTQDGATPTQTYEFRVDPSSLPDFDPELHSVVPGTVTLNWDPDGGTATTLALASPSAGSFVSTTTSGQGTVVIFDHASGFGSVEFAGSEEIVLGGDGVNITIDYTPASATNSVTDDGLGGLPAGSVLTGAGTLSYTDGSYSFTTTAGAIPHDDARILASYSINAWDLNPISKGTWANDMKLQVTGDTDFFTASTATFSRFEVSVLLLNTETGNFDVVETFDELSFSDTTDSRYFADVLNELSDFVNVSEPAGDEAPNQLNGFSRAQVIGGGDESTAGKTFTGITLDEVPVAPRTVTITVTDTSGDTQTITDDGSGNLTGWVDATGTNTINYTTGAVEVTTQAELNAGSLVTVAYYQDATETTHEEEFSGGTDGTFDSTNYGRDQFTAPALSSSNSGIFALNKVDEIMQVTVPDFVGDVTITGDILDYVEGRVTEPAGGDRFAILQPPVGSSAQEATDWLRFDLNRSSKYAAVYWPHVRVADPLSDNRPKTMPAVNHIAGIYARTDANRNVGKAPGGTVDGALRFLTGLELDPTQGQRDFVYPLKVNPLINTPQTGRAVWGVRTIAAESEWRYIQARRTFMFVERSVFNATQWIVFESNGPALWSRIRAQLTAFLTNVFNEGVLAGNSPAEAFFVIVDNSNNNASTIAAGQVIIDVGLAPNRPAEFVRFRFTQVAA